MMRWRMASSSSPNCSSCSSVRVVVLVMSLLLGSGSEVHVAVAHGSVHADLDVLVGQRGLDAGDHVAHGPGGLARGAGEADAHAAAVLGLQPERLRLLEQRGAGVGGRLLGLLEGDGAA